MKIKYLLNATIITCSFYVMNVQAQTMVMVKPSNANIQYTGRIDYTNPDKLVFSFPGVSIKAKFEGTSINALITDYSYGGATATTYFNVIIDDGAPTSFSVSSAQTVYTLASGLTNGTHIVELFKRTESSVGKVAFEGFQIETGKNILTPDPLPTKKIEFIGNSITCGYGVEISTATPTSFTSINENNYKAWGATTARNLNAQYSCVAFSGRGLQYNYDGSTIGTLPKLYDYATSDGTTLWDHTKFTPDIVVINLGTNDFSAETQNLTTIDSTIWVTNYVAFVTKLRGYYPKAKIICAVGVMMSDNWPTGKKQWTRIQKYASSVKTYMNIQGDNNVFYFKMDPQSSPYGEDYHPTAITQASMATKLTAFINTLNVWNCTATVSLGSDITTCGSTFPITLNSTSTAYSGVTYKWYKDDVIIQNATSSTYQITSSTGAAGKYKVVRDSTTCSASDEMIVSSTMSKPNLGSAVELCNPASATLDAGVTAQGITYVWKKDNQVIAGATTKTIQVDNAGSYTVAVASGSCNAISDPVVVTSKLLTVTSDTICSAGSINLKASGGTGSYEWYNLSTAGNLLFTGASYTPTVSANTVFYVKDAGGVSSTIGISTQSANFWGLTGTDFASTDKQQKLIVTQACTLSKLAVYTYAAGNDVTIRVMNGTTIVASKTQTNVGVGKQFIQCDFSLPQGTYNLDAVGTTGYLLYQIDGAAFPYTVPGVISMTYVEAWSSTYNGLFYDLNILVGNACARTPVNVVIDAANPNCKSTSIDINEKMNTGFVMYPNPANTKLEIQNAKLDNQTTKLQIFNALGQSVLLADLKNTSYDISTLSNGVYFVKIGSVTKKLIVKKD